MTSRQRDTWNRLLRIIFSLNLGNERVRLLFTSQYDDITWLPSKMVWFSMLADPDVIIILGSFHVFGAYVGESGRWNQISKPAFPHGIKFCQKGKTYILVKFNTLTVRSEEPHQVNERTLCYRACSVAYHRWRQNELRTKKVAREAQQMDKIHVNPLSPKSD